MADRITQIQDCLDQLLTQMYATIKYIDTRHAFASIPSQPDQSVPPATAAAANATANINNVNTTADAPATQVEVQEQQQQQDEPSGIEPVADPLFNQRLQELAQDLVIKEQQIEALVAALPGVGNSQKMQEQRLAELQEELVKLDEEAKVWQDEKQLLVERLDDRLHGIMRI